MKGKSRPLSTLIEQQIPQFISDEYPIFVEFVKKYYEQLEVRGQPLDIIQNLSSYTDIDTYNREIFKQNTVLTSNIGSTDTTISVDDTSSFPHTNGYALIDNEVIFYQSKTASSFLNCYRNVSATTKLGDLYHQPEIKRVDYKDLGIGVSHTANSKVFNVSNLFLYAFVKNFETQYLSSFPEESLKEQVDKKVLIKNIKKFYQAKGTDQSINFIFNSIVSEDTGNIPTVYYPKDSTFKSSGGKWIKTFSLKAKIISGDPYKLIGQRITQFLDPYNESVKNAFAIVDDVASLGGSYYEIMLAENTVVGEFKIASETFLTKTLSASAGENSKINVYSTFGWDLSRDRVVIGNEEIVYDGKSINQFTILNRGTSPQTYFVDQNSPKIPVYSLSTVSGFYDENNVRNEVRFLILGVLYNLNVENASPYSFSGDNIEKSASGFSTTDPIIYDKFKINLDGSIGEIRWKINENFISPVISVNPLLTSQLSDIIADVSSIFEDSQYYYICSSGIPSHSIGNSSWTELSGQKQLKIIKKVPERSTEIYKTPVKDVGIFVNGVTVRGYKDEEDVVFGGITDISVNNKGSGYLNVPFVLIEEKLGVSTEAKAIAFLAGETVDRIEITNPGSGYFPPSPTITITSGRNAVLRAVVTSGKVTSIVVVNPGEYYSTAPEIRIIDKLGKGRFAKFKSVISSNGQIVGCVPEDTGKFYTQENIEVQVIPIGSGATASSEVRSWKKNRFYKLKSGLDSSYGYFFENDGNGNCYSYVANPIALRVSLNDNLDSVGNVPSVLSHSPILGYAYDGNPIYGPYGLSNPLDKNSSIQRMDSSYYLKSNRVGGPGTDLYPLGSLIEDYQYLHRYGTLDENNGRFCITPEYPNGTYAYFTTIDSNNIPVFPYILGKNYYSLPVDSNYTKQISQDQIPKTVKRIRYGNIPEKGFYSSAVIESASIGEVSNVDVQYSNNNFSVDCLVETDYTNVSGSGIKASVSSVVGKSVTTLQNYQTKTIQIETLSPCYFYDGEIIRQSSGIYGTLVGNVFDGNKLVLRNVSGTFTKTNPISTDIKVVRLVVDRSSTFTENSTIKLKNGTSAIINSLNNNIIGISSNPFVDGDPISFTGSFSSIVANELYYVTNSTSNGFRVALTPGGPPLTLTNASNIISSAIGEKARGIVLERVDNKNTVKIRILFGTFDDNPNYYLESSTLTDSIGSKIFLLNQLSENIEIFSIDDNIALVKTAENHRLFLGDKINVDIDPSDLLTETNYYVRRRVYQTVKLKQPQISTKIQDTGIGRIQVLNSGSYFQNSAVTGDYANGGNQTYNNVELIFLDQTKCRNEFGDVVGSSGNATIGKPGNSNNARANISITNGVVTSVVIVDKGSNYILTDILTCTPSSLGRPVSSTNTQNLKLNVDHIGVSSSNTVLNLEDISNISINDYLTLDKEIVKVISVSPLDSSVNIIRGQYGTTAVDHTNELEVNGYNVSYRISYPYTIGTQSSSAIIKSYDSNTHILDVVYNLALPINTISSLTEGYTFYDQSTPKKLVTVESVISDSEYKFEFSRNTNDADYVKNPSLNLQKYYSYKFDTSHPSLSGSFLEFSPSINYNIITTESTKSNVLPGNVGSFIKLKIGYGAALSSNNFSVKETIDFSNFYYFDKAGIISSDKSYFNLIDDPLQGEHTITYSTPNYFVYSLKTIPQWDGSGTITYTTTSKTAVGQINKIKILSTGTNLDRVPVITGIRASNYTECVTDVVWNADAQFISSVKILNNGYGYSKPKVVIVDGDGIDASFDIAIGNNGVIRGISVINRGKRFTYKPTIKVIETDIRCYYESKNIGLPKSIKIESNGYGFYNDDSISNEFKSYTTLILSDLTENSFEPGEEVVQYESNAEIARGKITLDGYRRKSNIVKIITTSGNFKENISLYGIKNKNTATVKQIYRTVFKDEIKSYINNVGKYLSENSIIGINTQKITDSYFYQDYSYAIKSKTQIKDWRTLITQTTHPAGFKVFGELSVESLEKEVKINDVREEIVSIIQLWDEDTNHIRVVSENTRREIISNVIKVSDLSSENGRGGVYAPIYDTGETIAYDFFLQEPFDGTINESGNRVGRTTFTMKLSSVTPLNVSNINNLFVTIDGIFQEPGKAYTISGDQITFADPPLGWRDENDNTPPASLIAGWETYTDASYAPAQKFIGRFVKFKDNTLNSQYFKKIKDISSQFNSQKTNFDLYYEDNTPVELSYFENLLVSIDGVIQQAGVTPVFPGDRAYYIKRTSIPNQIIFTEPPRKFEDTTQSFYAYNVGAYERLQIDYRYVNDKKTGPFIIKSPLTNKSITVDEERNVLVFLDGVLQKRKKAYDIRGASITFTEPLRKGQKLNLLYLFGRDYLKTLIAFDFEQSLFFNYFKIAITTPVNTFDAIAKIGITAYQGTSLYNYTSIATLTNIERVYGSSQTYNLYFETAQNKPFTALDNLKFADEKTLTNLLTIPTSQIISVDAFAEDGDTLDILRKSQNTFADFIKVGDEIKIDGEESYRKVLTTPSEILKTEYRQEEDVNSGYVGRIGVTGYNAEPSGEGLDVIAIVDTELTSPNYGEIIELKWNKKEWQEYFDNNIVPSGAGYGYSSYPILKFIPQPVRDSNGNILANQPAQGGGAEGYAITNGNEITDVILTNSGSGYLTSPKVYVTREYKVKRVVSFENFVNLNIEAPEISVSNITVTSAIVTNPEALLQYDIVSVVSEGIAPISQTVGFQNIEIITPEQSQISIPSGEDQPPAVQYRFLQIPSQLIDTIASNPQFTSTINVENESIAILDKSEIIHSIPSGVVDTNVLTGLNSQNYSTNILGNRWECAKEMFFLDSGSANVSGLSIAEFNDKYPNITINDIDQPNLNSVLLSANAYFWDNGYPSSQEYATRLQTQNLPAVGGGGYLATGAIVYVQTTSGFPSSGSILIGKEIITYTSKLSDRFLGCTRGAYNSPISTQTIGDYVRTVSAPL